MWTTGGGSAGGGGGGNPRSSRPGMTMAGPEPYIGGRRCARTCTNRDTTLPRTSSISRRSSSVRAMQFKHWTMQVAALHASQSWSRVHCARERHRRHSVRCARTSGGGCGTSDDE
eukprot:5226816-Alexandrium_andersonii.AAC.1